MLNVTGNGVKVWVVLVSQQDDDLPYPKELNSCAVFSSLENAKEYVNAKSNAWLGMDYAIEREDDMTRVVDYESEDALGFELIRWTIIPTVIDEFMNKGM